MATPKSLAMNSVAPTVFALLGPQGCGKGEQGTLLAEQGFIIKGTGDMSRDRRAEDAAFETKYGTTIDGGDLLPNDVIGEMIQHVLSELDLHCAGLVLDGAMRTALQVREIGGFLLGEGFEVILIHIQVSNEVCLSRLLDEHGQPRRKGRRDDTPTSIRRRLDIYRENESAILAACDELGIRILPIDGIGTIPEVAGRIKTALGL